MFTLVARKPVWRLRSGGTVPISNGCFLADDSTLGEMSDAAKSFVQSQFPLLDVPPDMRRRLEAWGVQGLKTVTPPVVRTLMKQQLTAGLLTREVYTPEVAAELLAYCTSDVLLSLSDSDAQQPAVATSPAAGGENIAQTGHQQQVPNGGPFGQAGQFNAPPEVAAAMNAAANGVQNFISNVAGLLGTEPQRAAGSPGPVSSVPVNLDALREIKGLPFLTANGAMLLFGHQP
jgi:hypothetical protein